ncbi:MAG: helix-turn-helix domain-containing protein [Bacteroidales bacterium]|jgi:excisionase family DNA binding protein|nr:helix-turn-helix domain-containing protein [Bacteroidales bacterium]
MEKKWLSVDETSEYLGVKRDTIYRWIEKRGLPAYRIGRLWKFSAEDLDAWVKSGKAEDKSQSNDNEQDK